LLLLALPAAPAVVVKIERMSPPPLDLEVPLPGRTPVISADGRFVAFVVQEDAGAGEFRHPGLEELWVRDRQSGTAERIAVGYSPAISADGRFVAFRSDASNLVPGDTNGQADVFVRDRQTGKTELVSVSTSGAQANGPSSSPAISADGRFVTFLSFATDLVPGDTNSRFDVFVAERQ
jgi:Tol biopolymer transport system component